MLLDDPEVQLIVSAGIPGERADIAIAAMRHGKDVMVDKAGVITEAQLDAVRATQQATGPHLVDRLLRAFRGAGGDPCGGARPVRRDRPRRADRGLRPASPEPPHAARLVLPARPYRRHPDRHRLAPDRPVPVLHGLDDAEIVTSAVANYVNPKTPEFEDFGEILLRSEQGQGYIRVDWYTPDGLATWGDGRLLILGTKGYIELRKYIDIAGREGTDHLFLVTDQETRYVDCRDAPLPYYERLRNDIFERTETAMPQAHCFKVCELALRAQAQAKRLA